MRIQKITNCVNYASKKQIAFGRFADDRARQIASNYLNECSMFEAKTVKGLIFYSKGNDILAVKDEDYIKSKGLKEEYDRIVKPKRLENLLDMDGMNLDILVSLGYDIEFPSEDETPSNDEPPMSTVERIQNDRENGGFGFTDFL